MANGDADGGYFAPELPAVEHAPGYERYNVRGRRCSGSEVGRTEGGRARCACCGARQGAATETFRCFVPEPCALARYALLSNAVLCCAAGRGDGDVRP